MYTGRTPPGVRELKLRVWSKVNLLKLSRTPPGVRELKPGRGRAKDGRGASRTPPGVRELKLSEITKDAPQKGSHPSRGA